MNLPIKTITAACIAFFSVLTVLSGWYTIDEGERGVILRNGAMTGVAQPGPHVKLPWIDTVKKISVQTQTVTYKDMESYSHDQQPAHLKVSVTYHVDKTKVETIYAKYGSVENAVARIITPFINRDAKIVFGRFTAVTAIQDRAKLNSQVKEALIAAMGDDGLVIETASVEDIQYSQGYIHMIEQRMKAEVEVQQLRQNALRETVQAEITKTRADAEATAVKARAQAEASAIQMRGDAEGKAIKAKGEALRDNPQLVELIKAERWNGVTPTHMLPGSTIPMVNISSK